MKHVGIFEGKTHFSRLVGEAERGETIVITKNGRPVAQLSAIAGSAEIQSPESAFEMLVSRNRTLGVSVRTLLDEGRR
jgi:prevent-host-death family protein